VLTVKKIHLMMMQMMLETMTALNFLKNLIGSLVLVTIYLTLHMPQTIVMMAQYAHALGRILSALLHQISSAYFTHHGIHQSYLHLANAWNRVSMRNCRVLLILWVKIASRELKTIVKLGVKLSTTIPKRRKS